MDINVNYHSSIRIKNIYVDPYNINENSNDASYVFITHSHYDHFSINDIKRVINDDSVFVCTVDVEKELKKIFDNKIIGVEPNCDYEVGNIKFSTFPSYNINKKFHPKNNDWVGYIIEIDNVKYAILGDSDLTDEVKKIKCDVLFVPIGGTYTMNAIEASELTNIIRPSLVIPVHYNGIVGSKDDEGKFLSKIDSSIRYMLFV